jgi:hypothetical protein
VVAHWRSLPCLCALGVGLFLLAGCGSTAIEKHDPVELAGRVDPSLSAEQQELQAGVVRVLSAVQRGIAFEYLADHVAGVRWEESPAEFYQGAVSLARWRFVGPPEGNRMPLELVFVLDAPGFPERNERRVYAVTRAGGAIVVRRAS